MKKNNNNALTLAAAAASAARANRLPRSIRPAIAAEGGTACKGYPFQKFHFLMSIIIGISTV